MLFTEMNISVWNQVTAAMIRLSTPGGGAQRTADRTLHAKIQAMYICGMFPK